MKATKRSHSTPLRRKNRGAAAVELALLAIPLVAMVLATIDFARAMYEYDQLVKVVRDGARYLTFFDPTDNDYPIDLAKTRMLYGSVNGSGAPVVPGLTAGMISVCDRAHPCAGVALADIDTGSGTINLLRVSVTGYQFTPLFPGVSKLTNIVFDPISVTMRQLY